MALRAGYYGLKKKILEKVTGMPAIKSIGSGLALNSSTGELSATGVEVSIEGNPEGEATAGNLTKLQIGNDIFNVPDTTYSNATTENAGLMSSADKRKLNGLDKDAYFLRSEQAVLGAKNLFDPQILAKNSSVYAVSGDDVTASVSDDLSWPDIGVIPLKKGTYILSRTNTAGITSYRTSDDSYGTSITIGVGVDSVTIILANDGGIKVKGFTGGEWTYPATGKFMIRLASDPDDTYVPYAMTNEELTKKVFEKRTLTSADDLNDIKETGIYNITTSPTNAPENITYSTLIVEGSANGVRQIIIQSGTLSASIYTRGYVGSPMAWKSWYNFTGTVVS